MAMTMSVLKSMHWRDKQEFNESDVVRWKEALKRALPLQVSEIFSRVLEASDSHKQLSDIKKLDAALHQLLLSGGCPDEVVNVLVEMHSSCTSRHPVQRAIASVLQRLPPSQLCSVVKCIGITIAKAISGQWISDSIKTLQYIEVLMENFPSGENALMERVPLVVQYCVSVISTSSQDNVTAEPLLILAMKVTMTVLHKMSTVLHSLLDSPQSLEGGSMIASIVWPESLAEESDEGKSHWIQQQLQHIHSYCEKLLQTAATVPHDVVITGAMLYGVAVVTRFDGEGLAKRVEEMTHGLLEKDSRLLPFAQLAVCHAMLAKLPSAILIGEIVEQKPLLLLLFPIVCKLFESFSESSDRYMASRTLALWTSVAKDCVEQIAPESLVYESLLPSGEIVQTLLQFVWTLWEDPIDGIRHQCNEMFDSVVRMSLKLQSGDFLQSLAKTLLSLETPTRGKYILLTLLTQHVPVGTILGTSPDLPQELLRAMGHQVLACHAGELWSRLVTLHWQSLGEDKLDIWCETWVRTLVHCMCCSSPLARQHTIQYCLLSLLQCTGKCILYIKQSLEGYSEASPESKLVTQLACLRCAKNERKDFTWEESFDSICSVAMHHADEQVRVSALGLLCESHRTTEPPQLSSLPLVLQFMELNANSQSPGFRYPVLTAIKKLLIRIKDSSYALVKQHQKGHAASPDEVIAAHQAFLHRMLEQQFIALNPLSSYQRRNFVISILQLLSTIFPDQAPEVGIPPVFEFGSAVSKPQTRCLLNSLQDSYDPNRAGALELLLKVPENKLGFEDVGFLKQCASTYYRLATSPKAVNCTTASFLLQLLVCRRGKDFNEALKAIVQQTLDDDDAFTDDKPNEKAPQFTTIHILYKVLLQHISTARENLVHASIAAPMYGVLQSLRVALKEAVSRAPMLAVFSTYQEITAEIIGICETVASIVSPVVCNSSPEGFLPEAASQLESSQVAEGAPTSTGNAQSLLLCCWHSMKEISLLLGFIVESSPDTQKDDSILTVQQLDTIASIFIHQLTEARHRGAFEMAYAGFSKLCQYLWRSASHHLHTMVSVWVEELLDSLQSTSRTKILSVTRRSAGLPFYLQAILCAEPSHTGRQCLKTTMKALLRVAKSYRTLTSADIGTTDTSSAESQHQSVAVHALNILRALFKDSRLGETIVPFIPDGVMIAIEGFAAVFWPIRNSSTLLFSALFTRIFGAKRAQDEHSMENKTTAKEFFSRFPTLYQFLLQQLQASAHLLEIQGKSILQPSLFPVLLLLSRLYPSVLDDVHSPFTLKPFLPLLLKCVSCGEWKGRVLISRAIMPMVTAVNVEPLVCEVVSQLNLKRQNQLHGLLLIVERMIVDHSKFLRLDCDEHSSVAHLLLHLLLDKQVISADQNPCVATRTLYLDVLVSVVRHICEQKKFDGIAEQDQFKLVQEAESNPKDPTLSPDIFIARTRLLLLLTRCIDESKRRFSVNDIYCKCLELRNQAVRLFALEYINTKEPQLPVNDFEAICPIVVSLLWDETSEDVLAQTYTFLAIAVETIGTKCLKYPDSGSEGDRMQFVHQALVMAERKHIRVELQVSLIHFISVALTSAEGLDDSKTVIAFLAVLEGSSTPTKPVELHIAVAAELSGLWKLVLKELGSARTFCRLVLLMLQDVDPDVREKAASSLGAVLQSLPQGHSLTDSLLPLQNPNAPSVLKWFLKMISVMLPREMALDILLGLLSLEDKRPMDSSSSNVLFDEDRLNDYLEEVVLTQSICNCIEDFIRTHHSLPGSELQSIVEKLVFQLQSIHSECSFISPWEKQYAFMCICKLVLLSRALLHSLDAHCVHVVALKKSVSSVLTECASLHPIFHISGFI